MESFSGRRRSTAAVFIAVLVFLFLQAPSIDSYFSNVDHGYQLCMGQQIQYGKVPGVDLYLAYGPLVMLSTALGIGLSGSLVGETLLCAAGYALALAIAFSLVARHASRAAGLSAVVFGWLLLGRFYKWYTWLLPALMILALLGVARALSRAAPGTASGRAGKRAAALLIAGGSAGLTFLFRWDLGTTGAAAMGVFLVVLATGSRPLDLGRLVRELALLSLGFALPLAAWLLYLIAARGWSAPALWVSSTLSGSRGVATAMALPLPRIDARYWLSAPNLLVASFWLLPLTYLLGVGFAAARELRGNGSERSRLLLASSLIGLALLHQALHRRDGLHVLQVVLPAIVSAHVIAAAFLERIGSLGRIARAGGLAYLTSLVVCALGLEVWGRFDLSPLRWAPGERLAALSRPLEHTRRERDVEVIRAIREHAGPDDSILCFPTWPQLYFLAKRPMSGAIHSYYPGVYDSPPWSERNLERIRDDMPAILLAPEDFLEPFTSQSQFFQRRRAHFALERFLRETYTEPVLRRPGMLLLRRAARR